MIPKAMRRGSLPPGVMPPLAAWQPSAAWHAATRRGYRHCSPLISAQCKPGTIKGRPLRDRDRVAEQRHKPEIHMQLLVAVKQRQPRIVGDEVKLKLLKSAQHDYVLDYSGGRLAGDARQFEACRCGCRGWMSSLALRNASR